jgi:hypothetical protein
MRMKLTLPSQELGSRRLEAVSVVTLIDCEGYGCSQNRLGSDLGGEVACTQPQ